MPVSKFVISSKDKKLTTSILKKIDDKKKDSEVKIMSFGSLFKLLTKDEEVLVKRIRDIKPISYGFKGKYLGIQNIPRNLIAIRNQKYSVKNKTIRLETQYVPEPVFLAYKKLNKKLYKDIKRKLLIESGYRSPAYQVIIFLYFLNFYKFNFSKTAKRVVIPGYSEHCFPKRQAVDFMTIDGVPGDEHPLDFAKTIEYKRLLENANDFGFYQSYPRNNKLGVMFEPWHWQFRK